MGLNPATADRLRLCSSAILLANPDHNSALNARKRLVVLGLMNEGLELHVSSVLLSVPRNSKSSLLWQHRRWLLYRQHPPALPQKSMCSRAMEFTLVSRATQHYPRNYHAWKIGLVGSMEYDSVVDEEYEFATKWIEGHLADTSSCNYLVKLLKRCISPNSPRGYLLVSSLNHATSLVRSYPSHEACWMYLRQVYCLMEPNVRESWVAENRDYLMSNGTHDAQAQQLNARGASPPTAADVAVQNAELGRVHMERFTRFVKYVNSVGQPDRPCH
ncbi:uncharacterized protein EI90DRAFT_3041971 [Cantharellus anzutake]|uniref:uncharacterized protein n=1 Tax=Cantharellus anzutake TaxID=1750568 RepID=UPI00190592A4|nr:uncharacterized protein EI90DRAFT_3041971 [Cantharellus anzutake]KAF8338186.1 hypothetical protein EI90DRAFT_3041971 [Cantharellus anzutake]